MAAPQVVALRALRMNDRREMQRMGTEKVLAFWQSMSAMGLEMAKANQEYLLLATQHWCSPWTNPWSMASAATKVLEQGLAPVHKMASANARRLSRFRKR